MTSSRMLVFPGYKCKTLSRLFLLVGMPFINRHDTISVRVWRRRECWIFPVINATRWVDYSYWWVYNSTNRRDAIIVHVWRHWGFPYCATYKQYNMSSHVRPIYWFGLFTQAYVCVHGRIYLSRHAWALEAATRPSPPDAYNGNSQSTKISKANGTIGSEITIIRPACPLRLWIIIIEPIGMYFILSLG